MPRQQKPVLQLTNTPEEQLIKQWNSAVEAAESLGIKPGSIYNACKGHLVTFAGYRWRWADPVLAAQFVPKTGQHGGHTKRDVRCLTDGTEYESLQQAAEHYGVRYTEIIGVCSGRRTHVKGLRFQYGDATITTNTPTENSTENCLVCQMEFANRRALATHLQYFHKVSSEDYTIRYLLNGVRPVCLECGQPTRYATFKFKSYCLKHSHIAESIGGKVGGTGKKPWNTGLTKNDDIRLFNQSLAVTGPRNHFHGKHHTKEMIAGMVVTKRLSEQEWTSRIQKRSTEFTCLSTYDDYQSRQRQKLKVVCKRCGLLQEKTLMAFERGSLCVKCFPFVTSKDEVAVGEFVQSLGFADIERGNRQVIGPKELDIYVPSKKFAVEYNGLYWHMDRGQAEFYKSKHHDKMLECRNKGITLFQVFSDEWLGNPSLVQSMIRSRLGVSPHSVGARDCEVTTDLTVDACRSFFDRTHISGWTPANKTFALMLSGKPVAMLSVRLPRQKKKYPDTLEIARFSSELDHNVRGGFAKLLARATAYARELGCTQLLSYCDLRFGHGNVYTKTGFEMIAENSGLNYWYTDGITRFDRFKFRAQPGKTEKQVAQEAGVYRIYGCSNTVFVKTLPTAFAES